MPGLSENSPVKLSFERENFNALIGRHSQPIRWLNSEMCPCAGDNLLVDENCPICNGNEVTYDTPTESERLETLTAPIDGVIEQDNVIWVRDFSGNEYTITSQDCVAYVDGVLKGRQYQVLYKESIKLSGSGIANYISDKLYSIDIPSPVKFDIVQGTLLLVTASFDGTPLTVTDLFRNCFTISDDLNPEDQVDVVYDYVNPFNFALLNNSFSKQETKFLLEIGGSGILIFPQRWKIFEEDIIVALNATETKKVLKRSTGVVDTLPSFYIYKLLSAYSIRDGEKYRFIPERDFVIYKGDQIKWINNPPDENEQVSFTYLYNTVYTVMREIPSPRTSENNRFPRKVALQLYTDSNQRKVI